MKGFYLSETEQEQLRESHKKAKLVSASCAYRINAVLLLGTGWTLERVNAALLIDDETLRNHVSRYREGGVDFLCKRFHKGSEAHLDEKEQRKLCEELDRKIYQTTKEISLYVSNHFKKSYTPSGMRDLLKRMGYVYKKPKLTPGNPDVEEQESFVEYYEEFMETKPETAEVLFLDAVHPEHNAIAASGWMRKGEERQLKTNSGRQRLNLHGAINAESHEVTVIESETIDAESTIMILRTLQNKYKESSELYVILDNARYHYSNKVKEFVTGSNIRLVFLPSYSPNLNLVERLWKFFKNKVLHNQYYENVDKFRKSCIKFFSNLEPYKEEIANFMNGEFHIIYDTS